MASHPAARQGDEVRHDPAAPCGEIGPPAAAGKGVVRIEGRPAAHVLCSVRCTGKAPGGDKHPAPQMVAGGSGTVRINGRRATRWAASGDVTSCGAAVGSPGAARSVFIGGPSDNRKTLKLRVVVVKGTRWDTQEGRLQIQRQIQEAERILGINIDATDVELLDRESAQVVASAEWTWRRYSDEEVALINELGPENGLVAVFTDDTRAGAIAVMKPAAAFYDGLQKEGALIGNEQLNEPYTLAHELTHVMGGANHAKDNDVTNVMQKNAKGDQLTDPWKSNVDKSPHLE